MAEKRSAFKIFMNTTPKETSATYGIGLLSEHVHQHHVRIGITADGEADPHLIDKIESTRKEADIRDRYKDSTEQSGLLQETFALYSTAGAALTPRQLMV